MNRIAAGTKDGTGYYWNVGRWEFANVGPEGGVLKGESKDAFVKVPYGVALVAGPLLGLVFLVLAPVIALALIVGYAVKRVATKAHGDLAAVVQPPLATGAAYLTGTKPSDHAEPAKDAEIEKLAKEVGERRNEQK